MRPLKGASRSAARKESETTVSRCSALGKGLLNSPSSLPGMYPRVVLKYSVLPLTRLGGWGLLQLNTPSPANVSTGNGATLEVGCVDAACGVCGMHADAVWSIQC